MQELTNRDVMVTDSFWSPRLAVNAKKAIFHQWQQLEATGRRAPTDIFSAQLDPTSLREEFVPDLLGDVSSFMPKPWMPGR